MVISRTRCTGFTLIELLVALAVFAVLAGIVYGALDAVLDTREQTDSKNQRRAQIMHAITLMERDLLQMSRRSIWDEFDRLSPALVVEQPPAGRIEFTRAGLLNPRQLKRSHLQRVAYRISEDQLVRDIWPVLDRTAQTAPLTEALLENVEDISFEALTTQWSDTWPDESDNPPELPRAIRVVLTLEDMGPIERVVPVAGG